MRIEWELNDSADITLEDLVGDISIVSGEATVGERSTYLDSWMAALIVGVEGVRDAKRVSVEIVEEPHPLIFEPQGSGVRLVYRDTSLIIDSIDEFTDALRGAVANFLTRLEDMNKFKKRELQDLANRLKILLIRSADPDS